MTLQTLHDVYGINRFCTIHDPGLWMPGADRSGSYEVPDELAGLERDELLEAIRARPEPFFIKSHRPEDSADPAPALYIVRDGRDVHVSRAHFLTGRKVGDYELPFDQRLRELVTHRAWSEHVRTWRNREAPTAIIRYEDLVADPGGTVKARCQEIGVPLPEPIGELKSFSELQERNPIQHRKGKTGSWQEEMPLEIEERFWGIHWEEMEALGYE
jgi:hypothetical protein